MLALMGWSKTEPTLTPTNVTNIFIPEGELVPKADYATLKINLNVTTIFDETREVCHIAAVIDEFVAKRTKNKLSAPNKKVLSVIRKNIKDLCEDDKNQMTMIKTSFGFTDMSLITKRHKRQFIVAATVVITSLVTYFSTKELISMSSQDDEDELYDTTNHIISAIKDHETRLTRLESKQKQLDKHITKLTGALVMGIQSADIFYDMYATSTYATQLSGHIKDINIGLFTLLNNGRLHPNLVSWTKLSEGIDNLKKEALKRSKKLILEHPSDVYQLKTDFVAFNNGMIAILVHIPVASQNKFKLYKYVSTPTFNEKYQFLVDTSSQFLAVNEDTTLYTVLKDLNGCTYNRDTAICNKINILHKSGKGKNCLFDLYNNDLKSAAQTCKYRVGRPQNYAVRLSDKEIFVFYPNNTALTTKCHGDTSRKMYAQGANILTLDPGCRVHSTDFVFKRNRQLVEKEVAAVLVDSPSANIWDLLSKKAQDEEIKPFLDLMLQEEEKGIRVADIESKFNLHKLHHKTSVTTNLFSSISGVLVVLIIIVFLYACRHNLTCGKTSTFVTPVIRSPPTLMPSEQHMSMSEITTSLESFDSFLPTVEPTGARPKKKVAIKPRT